MTREAAQGPRGVIRSDVGVKSWAAALPDVEALRPGRCPACAAAGRPLGGALGLHGHGVRGRQVLGALVWEAVPVALEVGVRRYVCTTCRATCTVVPREVLHRRLYAAPAIALALALFGLLSRSAAGVRRAVSPWRHVGAAGALRWDALRAWTRAVRVGGLWPGLPACPADWTRRRLAARAATALAARAPQAAGPAPPPLHVLAPLGALVLAHAG